MRTTLLSEEYQPICQVSRMVRKLGHWTHLESKDILELFERV